VPVQSPLVATFRFEIHGRSLAVSFSNSIGGALGSFIAGYLFDISGSYQWTFTLCAVLGHNSFDTGVITENRPEAKRWPVSAK
jgi:MFS family permease